jgi:tetratricopeptide (TPR) repeat protein
LEAAIFALLLSTLWSAWAADPVELMRAHKPMEAVDAARENVIANPGNVEDHELLIDLMMNLGLGYDAEVAYLQFVEDNAIDAMAWYLLGRSALSAHRAETAYQKSLELEPDYARSWMGLASIERAKSNPTKAAELYRKALDMDPSLAEAWAGLAACHLDLDQEDQALLVAREATVAVPNDIEAYLAIAALDPGDTLEILEQGARNNPRSPEIWSALARGQIDAQDYEAARKSLDAALRLDPTHAQALVDDVILEELRSGRLDPIGQSELARARGISEDAPLAAELAFDDLVKRHPDCHLVWLARGHFHMQMELRTEAEADLRKAFELAPTSPDTQGALGMYLLGIGAYADAATLLRQAYTARPYDVQLGVSYGLALVGSEGTAVGLTALDQVASDHPTEISPVMAMVTVLTQANRPDAAHLVLERAVQKYAHPTLLLAYAASCHDTGDDEQAIITLRQLERMTGDPKYAAMADELEEG